MTSGMPELGSKISLISKADIRYEGRLFTVDPQECTIALANVRSFGTEDRETQFPVAPQNQVYEYILFRGSDIKDIRVLNSVNTIPNDPAIVQMTVPPSISQQSYQQQSGFGHSIVGPIGPINNQYGSSYGIQVSPVNTTMAINPQNRQGVLDIMNMGSRSTTPTSILTRKSPTADQGIQVGQQQQNSGIQSQQTCNINKVPEKHFRNTQNYHRDQDRNIGKSNVNMPTLEGKRENMVENLNKPNQQNLNQIITRPNQTSRSSRPGWAGNRGMMRNRGGRGRVNFRTNHLNATGFKPKNTLKFDNDYDFEQANTEFEELRLQLAKTKIDSASENEKKDDSGNETGAGDGEVEEDQEVVHYDKSKSFFDNISCEAVERSKGRSQRTDWRTERKLNSETFGVASMRRGGFRGRGFYPRVSNNTTFRHVNMGVTGIAQTTSRGSYRNNRGNNRKSNQAPESSDPQSRLTLEVQSSSKS